MKIYAPTYYSNFKCIANECEHNCCIGWEIDIDPITLEFYKTQKNIIDKIEMTPTPHFILDRKERCPFLLSNNLCEIIINHSEDKLCQICSDHPRFRNFYDTRMEIGLGLTCEAAAKLIIDNKLHLTKIDDDTDTITQNINEELFFRERDMYLNSSLDDLKECLNNITYNDIYKLFYPLERLDKAWDNYLLPLKNNKTKIKSIKETEKLNNILSYFIFRHLYTASIEFCVLCTLVIGATCKDIYETARMFSSEIEYSDQNIEKILEYLK